MPLEWRRRFKICDLEAMKKIIILDNYDSFTYNLVHIIRELGYDIDIFRNDKISVEQVSAYDKIILSPGPGIPDEAGILKTVVRELGASKSILGVCLGHQGVAEVYGASLFNIPNVLHGVTSKMEVLNSKEKLFKGLPNCFNVTHYHSWAVSPDSIPADVEVTAVNADGLIMAIAHRNHDVRGVQFHPESIMTEHGKAIMKNWIEN